jgi:hypothetical protein
VVLVALEILQSLGLRVFNPSVSACPGCGRTTSTTFQELAKQIDDHLRAMMPVWKSRYPGVETLKVAVMGCIVNGPGESKHADIGISLPGTALRRNSTRSSSATSSSASGTPPSRPERAATGFHAPNQPRRTGADPPCPNRRGPRRPPGRRCAPSRE